MNHFGVDREDSRIFVWGCSATFRRHDGLALEGVFDEITYHRSFLHMIEEKWYILYYSQFLVNKANHGFIIGGYAIP
jgi:hypothetical protein